MEVTLDHDIKIHYNQLHLPYFYSKFDFFRIHSTIANYRWDKDQRAFNVFFYSGTKKNFQLSSNMLFTFWPKSNLLHLRLQFWKYHKYLLKVNANLKIKITSIYNKALFDFFEFSLSDFILVKYGIYFFYGEIISKYLYKPFYFLNKYENSFDAINSFLTVGLFFNAFFSRSKFDWWNPYIKYYCWASDSSGLQKDYAFANFSYDSNKKLYSLKNLYNILYKNKFIKELYSKKIKIRINFFINNNFWFLFFHCFNFYFYFSFYFYFYLRFIFFGYNINNFCFNNTWLKNSLLFFLKSNLVFMPISVFKIKTFIPKAFTKKQFFSKLKEKFKRIDARFKNKKNYINIYPHISFKSKLNKFVINSFHNNFFISNYIKYNLKWKNKIKNYYWLNYFLKNNLINNNFLFLSFDTIVSNLQKKSFFKDFYKNNFIFFKSFFLLLKKKNLKLRRNRNTSKVNKIK